MRLTNEQRGVFVAAVEVAIAPPLKANPYAYAAKVPWKRVEQLRAALDAAGVDWRDAKVKQDRINAEAAREFDARERRKHGGAP